MKKLWLLLLVSCVSCDSFIAVRPIDYSDDDLGWELDCRDKEDGAALCRKKARILCGGAKHTKTIRTNQRGDHLIVKCVK